MLIDRRAIVHEAARQIHERWCGPDCKPATGCREAQIDLVDVSTAVDVAIDAMKKAAKKRQVPDAK